MVLLCATAAAAILAVAHPAWAQAGPSSQALFLETIRDPGSPDVASSARSLAMGGIRFGSGRAEDALASPATLVLGEGTDLVISGGPFFYARDELIATPNRFPPWAPERARSASSEALPFSVAIATRRSSWAVAAFVDRSAVLDHDFDTETANIYFAALQGTFISEDGTGHARLSQRISRLGGAVAFATPGRRFGAGVAVSAVRFDYEAAAGIDIDGESAFAGGPISEFTARQDVRARFLDWGPGVVVAAMARPLAALTVAARWEHTPELAGTRTSVYERVGVAERSEEAVRFHLPPTWAVGASFTAGATVVAAEFARTAFSDALLPVERTSGSDPCGLPNPNCPGWGIANYEAIDATTIRGGIEQSIATANGTLRFRGGAAHQDAYTVARPTSDPLRNGGSLPAPPFLADEEPPREATTWITGGIAYAWQNYELAVGVGRSPDQTRVLADFRLSLR